MTKKSAPRHAKQTSPTGRSKVSNWWYVVGGLVGLVAVFLFWWFVYPTIIGLFY